MKSIVTVAETKTPAGAKLSLCLHDGQYSLRLAGRQLMSTTTTGSETQMADLACETFKPTGRKHVLIGGLGLGFTLRRVLELVGADAKVQVAELLPQVVAWNREHLQSVNGALLGDARVEVLVEDVLTVLTRSQPKHYDAILLDVDNGPTALVDDSNARLYERRGLKAVSRALRVGCRAVFWSATTDRSFQGRLTEAGLRTQAVGAKAYAQAKRDTHMLFVGDRVG